MTATARRTVRVTTTVARASAYTRRKHWMTIVRRVDGRTDVIGTVLVHHDHQRISFCPAGSARLYPTIGAHA